MSITLTETQAPSRSKGRGWLRVDGRDGSFASPSGRTLAVEAGETLTLVTGVELRRASGRMDKERKVVQVVVTGDPSDTVTTSIGTPQSYDVTVCGVKEV